MDTVVGYAVVELSSEEVADPSSSRLLGELAERLPSAALFLPVSDSSGSAWILIEGEGRAALEAFVLDALGDRTRGGVVAAGSASVDRVFAQSDHEPGESAPYLMPLAFAAPEEELEYLDEFYATEHIPILLDCEDWRRSRTCRVAHHNVGPAWNRVVLHELRTPGALSHPAVGRAREADMMKVLSLRAWFTSPARLVLRHCGLNDL